jgi:hypothetical protein
MTFKSIWYYPISFLLPDCTGKVLLYSVFAVMLIQGLSHSQVKELNDVNYKKFYTVINGKDSVIALPDKFLIENTVSVYADSIKILPENYTVDYRFGKIIFHRFYLNGLFSDTAKRSISMIVAYQDYPYNIPDVYSKFEVLTKLDTTRADSMKIAEVKPDFIEDIFAGSNLEKSGSIFRGFTVGNNRDLTLNSGFRLQMQGNLSKDIDITAALTDENTPIQPEGNTQKLQELDKVFVELRTKNITTTLGDIDVNFSNLNFFNFSRKLQGAKGYVTLDKSDLFIAGAISRGRFNTNTFNGSDGVQGPYRLIGVDNEVNIVVIAGSEKVYLDGILMVRGETNDYTMDYTNGQLTFTNRRVVSNASRITVDFEYSDRKYSRSMIAGQTRTSLFNDRLKLGFSVIREKDDPDKPVDFTLSDSDKVILKNAGNDKFKASKSGVVFAGRDSTGRALGQYIQKDTVLSTGHFIFYVYSPGDTNALYQLSFTFVGAGQGDYNSLSTSSYRFVGIKQGSYLPIVILPMATQYQSADMNLDLILSRSVLFKVESAVSDYNQNLFSDLDKNGDRGVAVNSALVFNNDNFKLGSINLGGVGLTLKERFINKNYNSLDRLNPVEYNRVWDIQDSTNQTENTTEAELKMLPRKYISLQATGGRDTRGDYFKAYRGNINLNFIGDSVSLPALSYNADYISSRDNSIDYNSSWIRQNGLLNFKLTPKDKKWGLYNLFFQFNSEYKKTNSTYFDTSSTGSYSFYEFKPGLSIFSLLHLDLSYNFDYRIDNIADSGSVIRLSNSLTHNYSVRVKDFDFLSSNIDISFYDKKYSNTFLSRGYTDARTILVTSQSNLWFFNRGLQSNLFYKVSSERTAISQVVFYKVPVGQGNYIYLGDLNHNGIQDENEFQLVNYDGDYIKLIIPTDQLYPTTDLQSSAGFNIDPSKFAGAKSNSVFIDVMKNVSFDTYLAVAERSKDPNQKDIYLLRFSKFQNDANTISGSNTVQQDVNLFQNYQYFGIRLRFIEKKGFNQYYSGNERALNIERSTRVRLSFTSDLILQTDYVSTTDRNLAPELSFRNWNISGESVISELTYIPIKSIEAGFKLEVKRSTDLYPLNPTEANINDQTLKFTYSLETKGKLRIEVTRNEANLNLEPLFLPYELTKGISPGKSYVWSLAFDYRISNFIQATINYLGRAEEGTKVIHTGTAELRAYF